MSGSENVQINLVPPISRNTKQRKAHDYKQAEGVKKNMNIQKNKTKFY